RAKPSSLTGRPTHIQVRVNLGRASERGQPSDALRDQTDPLEPPAGRRRHFFLVGLFSLVRSARWSSGVRSERTLMWPPAARAALDRISHGVDFRHHPIETALNWGGAFLL